MKSAFTLIAILLLCLAFGCSDNPTAPAGNAVHISATVIAGDCFWWGPWHGPYTAYTGKKATVTLTREDGASYVQTADGSSQVRFTLDTGTYRVWVETFHSPKYSAETIHVVGDSPDLIFATELTYLPPDSLNIGLRYSPGEKVLSETEERESFDRLNASSHGLFDFTNAHRSVTVYFDTTWVRYEQIGVKQNMAGWKAERAAKAIIDRNPDLYPPRMEFFGYFHICLTN